MSQFREVKKKNISSLMFDVRPVEGGGFSRTKKPARRVVSFDTGSSKRQDFLGSLNEGSLDIRREKKFKYTASAEIGKTRKESVPNFSNKQGAVRNPKVKLSWREQLGNESAIEMKKPELEIREIPEMESRVFQFGELYKSKEIPIQYDYKWSGDKFEDADENRRGESDRERDIERERKEDLKNEFASEFYESDGGDDLTGEYFSENKKTVSIGLRLGKIAGIFSAPFGKLGEIFKVNPGLSFGPDFFPARKYVSSFLILFLVLFSIVPSLAFLNRGKSLEPRVEGLSAEAFRSIAYAKENIEEKDFVASKANFEDAYLQFSEASQEVAKLGGFTAELARFVPFTSKLASGKYALEAGKHLTNAGKNMSEVMSSFSRLENPLENQEVSLLALFNDSSSRLEEAHSDLESAEEYINKISIDDLPEDKRDQFILLKNSLPQINNALNVFLGHSQIFTDVLGGNGPRKYLFVFQNNQEMRATGGFIGSYGVLSISGGRISNFFIDGIYNPDGQLDVNVVPPKPIQKISAAWSTHDANWFPNFPTTAEKLGWFYEKTGGPTVDGVIAMTPTIMQKMLSVTGPIEMEEYETWVDEDNFIENTQYEVEEDYDKEENRPKKFIADLAPKVLDKLFNEKDLDKLFKAISVLHEGLSQKHILIYAKNFNIQKVITAQNWGGEVLNTRKDYLSVINSNINGYKTDGVVDEEIKHVAQIAEDGSIIDTVTIKRKHNGGNEEYEWWNKVNADYMRVYVPKGSRLLGAEGQTREFNEEPLDYEALGFSYDPTVMMQEDSMEIDEKTGTRIYEENNKTVFANWIYVSPGESVEVTYNYLLPFKVDLEESKKPTGSYSLLAQKQSGSLGSHFSSTVEYPDNLDIIWNYPDIKKDNAEVYYEADLSYDRYLGVVFGLPEVK